MSVRRALKCLLLHPADNVCVVTAGGGKVPKGHKMAIKKIGSNKPVMKLGQVIGLSNKHIMPGEHVHTHNMRFSDKIEFSHAGPRKVFRKEKSRLPLNFQGYLRKDGRAGTRNYIIVISTVNCAATVVREVARHFENIKLSKFRIDGVIPVIHNSGCAQALGGRSDKLLNRTIAGWFNHPNVVGAVVIGLGCEDVNIKSIMSELERKNKLRLPLFDSFNIQDAGGTKKAVALGDKKVQGMLSSLPSFKRVNLPSSLLTVALNCGGSDAFSAITANPALGIASDILVSYGGTVVLGETPECFGAEKLLSIRCALKKDKERLRDIFLRWRKLAKFHNISMNNNLAPGNIAGGISSILEKSLGAISKAGVSQIKQVLDYGQQISGKGLVFMDTPGFDPVSVTGLVAGGCNLVAFTTGRGSMYGCSIAPTIKIATNSELFNKFKNDMDLDAGKSLVKSSLEQVGREIYNSFIRVAGGNLTCSEKQGLGKEEFVPWQLGETL